MDPYGRNLGLLDRSRYCFFQVAPTDPLLVTKYGSAGNGTLTFGYVDRNSEHQTTAAVSSLLLRNIIFLLLVLIYVTG
jgi:hypothetical protein